ncbi:MAG: alpha-2-macroglobulin family protein [Rhodobacteraceae bacterium]|nr:alpha-2-macroglobulin family protein [Paracoccaceae bacterium]
MSIKQLITALSTGTVLALNVPLAGLAQTDSPPIPERRIEMFQSTDFFGSDLRNIFDVTYESCEAQCLADKACKAFTYNIKSSACFPKSAVGESSTFEGATSAVVIDADPVMIEKSRQRAADLEFLPGKYLHSATRVARRNGSYYPTNGWTAPNLTDLANEREAAGNPKRAIELHLAALNNVDSAGGWIEVARIANATKTKDSGLRRFLKDMAPSAAINGFLRARNSQAQATALSELAQALEKANRGRLSIPVLRLAYDRAPRKEIAEAIDRAVALYGFRVTDHRVDHNALQPRICAEFSESLVKAGVDYTDYVKIGQVGLAVEAEGRQLCIEGVKHGQNLRVTLRKGLPAGTGESLYKSVDLNVYVPDRDPSARFTGRSYVLPKRDGATIPITSVNLSRVGLNIYRIGDRNILRTIQAGLFRNPVSKWELGDLRWELGQKVWSGEADLEIELNREVTTALPIGEAIKEFEPGVYAMTAQDPGEEVDGSLSTQWFVVTDLGISTMVGNDGLHVFARSLGSAAPVGAAKVQLLARNNIVLGEGTTDASGYAHFPAGLVRGKSGNSPALVTVETTAGDFAFLDQAAAEFDLSDRGVAGRPAPPPIDVFLATDRGAYRPGEDLHTTLLSRDHKVAALADLPLTMTLIRPDGVEFASRLVSDAGAGGGTASFNLPGNAKRGTWKLRVYADKEADPLLERRILVEDFVPERIDFDLTVANAPVRATDTAVISVKARYLYGAPGADLAAEGEVKLTAASGLKGYPGYKFGRSDQYFNPRYQSLDYAPRTADDGSLELSMNLPVAEDANRPLAMEAFVRLRDGSSRPVERRIKSALEPSGPMVGIKPLFDGQAGEGSLAEFDVIAVGTGGKRITLPRVGWVLNKIRTRYQWYESYGDWSYEPVTRRERIASGEVSLSATDLARISGQVEYGRYELKLTNLSEPFVVSSYQFSAGWYVTSGSENTPDTLQMALDRGSYAVGDTAKLRIESRFDGVARISLLSDRLISTRTVNINAGANAIDLVVTEDWGAGAYVTATAIRPMDVAAGRNPSRALGLVFAKVDPGAKLLRTEFVSPAEAQPRTTMTTRLKIDGITPGQKAYATIAAVDVGVLNLTAFETPSPDDHYFGQRRLGVGIRDVYGRLIDGLQGRSGRLRSGGDSNAAQKLNSPPPSEEVLASFSGLLVADENGEVSADFDLPDFNGTVRLMAVVWSDTAVGHAEQDVLVRDPVVLSAHTPRFMTPGDKALAVVEMAHVFGPTGDFTLRVSGGEELQMPPVLQTVQLADKQRLSLSVPITAIAAGAPKIDIEVQTPGGRTLRKTVTLAVQYNDPEIARQTRLELAAGEAWNIDANTLAGLHRGTVHASLAVGPLARFDAPGLLSALNRYPYGCTEQITSKAMPLLYFEQLSSALGLANPAVVKKRVAQAITGVLSNQASNGAFGLWRPDSGDLWLDAYVTDFLSRARAQGFEVPDRAFEQSLNNLRNRVNYAPDFEDGGQDVAYALMVLAREGNAAIGDLRYYVDARADAFATPLAKAQMGAALASYGDQSRADRMFRLASKHILKPERSKGWRSDYGSHLRDAAALLTLAVDSGSLVVDQEALVRAVTLGPVANRSTQENLWSLMAANALAQGVSQGSFSLNGSPMTGPLVKSFSEADLNRGQILRNDGDKPTTTVVTVFGIPSEPEPAGGSGYKIERAYYTLEGTRVDPSSVVQNTRLVAVLKVTPFRKAEARLMINDPLPAGFEIDNPNLIAGGDIRALDWLALNTDIEYSEFRTDRFLTAVNWSGTQPFSLAYLVRAVSPGRFHHPAASVEDMYRPAFRARTDAGTLEVVKN